MQPRKPDLRVVAVEPGEDPREDALLAREVAGGGPRALDVDLDDLVIHGRIEHLGHETRPDPLNTVRAGAAAT
ncbi:hypothetical protein [Micromonospora globbae]|uniref:hypothetical protein n=1 Tax=Micromonospora globbae TaxID=1894969 RepID=UPI00342DAE32